MRVGRIIGAAVLGLLFMLFVALDLLIFGVLKLNSVVVSILPVVGLVLGGVLGAIAGNRQEEPVDTTPPADFIS